MVATLLKLEMGTLAASVRLVRNDGPAYLVVQASSLAAIDDCLAVAEKFEAKYGWLVAVRY